MIVMYITWMLIKRPRPPSAPISLPTDDDGEAREETPRPTFLRRIWRFISYNDMVDINTVNLHVDEYEEAPADLAEEEAHEKHLKGRWGWLWRVYYALV